MNRLVVSILLVVLCLSVSNITVASPPEYVNECFECHGENGISTESDIPIIAGASADFIQFTLYSYMDETRPAIETKYRTGDTDRPVTDMKKIAEGLTEDQIADVADYFSKLPFIAAKQDFDPAWAKIGKRIHDKKCNKCHGDGGSSATDNAGILAGQWSEYLIESMKHMKENSRQIDPKMKKKVDKLKDKEWRALINYYASKQN